MSSYHHNAILYTKLCLGPHIDNITTKANRLTYLLTKIRKYLNREQAVTVYKSTIRPVLEYCSSLFLVIQAQYSSKLERSQNIAIRVIIRAPRQFSVTTGRLLLDIPSLHSRRQFSFHKLITKKAVKGQVSVFSQQVLDGMLRHTRSLRKPTQFVKPYYRTNFGKACLPNLMYTALTTEPCLKYTTD